MGRASLPASSQAVRVDTAAEAERLLQERYDAALDRLVTPLDVRRSAHASRQSQLAARREQKQNGVALHKAVGAGWHAVDSRRAG